MQRDARRGVRHLHLEAVTLSSHSISCNTPREGHFTAHVHAAEAVVDAEHGLLDLVITTAVPAAANQRRATAWVVGCMAYARIPAALRHAYHQTLKVAAPRLKEQCIKWVGG